MPPVAECEMPSGAAIDQERIGFVELTLVSVGRTPLESNFGAFGDPNTVERHVSRDPPCEGLNRRVESKHFLDGRSDALRGADEPTACLVMPRE